MKYLLVIIAFMLVWPASGQRNKKDDDSAPVITEGVVYSLPRTGLRLYVKAVKESYVPGPYAAYAEQLLGVKNVATRAANQWKISEVNIETFAEPDPEQVHKAMGDAAYLVSLTAEGCLVGINAGVADVQPKPVKTNKILASPEKSEDFSFDYFNDKPLYSAGDSTNRFRPTRVSEEQKMAEAAKRVIECRRAQFEMAAGLLDEFHPDGEAYKASLNELKSIERKYMSLFTGKKTRSEDVFSFEIVPSKSSGKGEVVFRISDEKGIVPASDLSGKPVTLEFELEKSLNDKYAQLAKPENPQAAESTVFYRIPAIATVNVTSELSVISSVRTAFAQFGVVAPIPREWTNGNYVVKFHPETGAVKSVIKK